jgi:hypothetical protein
MVALRPVGIAPDPVFAEALDSLSVLPVAAGSLGFARAPGFGSCARSPYSSALLGLAGIDAASSPVAANFRAATSSGSLSRRFAEGPLTVERDELASGPDGLPDIGERERDFLLAIWEPFDERGFH